MIKKISILAVVMMFGFSGLYAQNKKLTEQDALKMLEACKTNVSQLQTKVNNLQSTLDGLKKEQSQKEQQISSLNEEISQTQEEIAKYKPEYIVAKGDYLAKIAAMRYVYNNAKAWPRIFRANRDKIKNPNLIYPGWVLTIPHGLVKDMKILPGDYLWKIAGFYWIYNNPKMWTKIYNANKDQIKDPDLIYPKQDLVIPRD